MNLDSSSNIIDIAKLQNKKQKSLVLIDVFSGANWCFILLL